MVIKEATSLPKEIYGSQEYRAFYEYSKSPYLVEVVSEDSVVIENTFTGEVRVESIQDWNNPSDIKLKEYVNNWYYIRNDLSLKTMISLARNLRKSKGEDTSKVINNYTIFTTLNCNAKCPYCYEAKYSKMPMSENIAIKAAEFIAKNRGDKTVRIGWFGGEPLVNSKVIDIITEYLSDRGIPYYSTMISNGYLFNKYNKEIIINKWKLNTVQITLDGMADTYNSVKGLGSDAFETVLKNIEFLNDLGVKVNIRMNLSNTNGEELLQLTEYLAERFKGRTKIFAYAHPLADDDQNKATKETFDMLIKIQERLLALDLSSDVDINKRPVLHCMADNDHHLCITPLGNFTPCEHYTESEFIGNLDDGVQFNECKEAWKELMPANEKCETCWRYPKCLRLKKCPGCMDCEHGMDAYWLFQEKHAIESRYKKYLAKDEAFTPVVRIPKQKVIDLALEEVGKTLQDRNYWSESFGKRPVRGWCTAFIYDMFTDAYRRDLADTALYTTGRRWQPESHYRLFDSLNRIYYTPEPGDIAFYNINGWIDHVELVTAVSENSENYNSVGGNIINDGVSKVVLRINVPVNNAQLVGFGRPGYTE